MIPRRSDERDPNDYDQTRYREHAMIERAINRLKRFRRIATRYEKLAVTHLVMVTIACILDWL